MWSPMSGASQGCVGGPLRLWYTSAHGSPGAPRSATSRRGLTELRDVVDLSAIAIGRLCAVNAT